MQISAPFLIFGETYSKLMTIRGSLLFYCILAYSEIKMSEKKPPRLSLGAIEI